MFRQEIEKVVLVESIQLLVMLRRKGGYKDPPVIFVHMLWFTLSVNVDLLVAAAGITPECFIVHL